MRFVLLLAVACLLLGPASSQSLLDENFDYPVGELLTDNGWINHSGTGNFLVVDAANLSLAGYPLNSGGSVVIVGQAASSEDVHRGFAPVSMPGSGGSTSVYTSFLVNAESVVTDEFGDYFFHLTQEPHDTNFKGRVYMRTPPPTEGGSATFHEFNFGVSKGSGSTDPIGWDLAIREVENTFLVVLKYTFFDGVDDDTVDLYVFADGDDFSVEPGSPTVSSIDPDPDMPNAGNVNLRQGSDPMTLTVDGIRVATAWADLVPVELVSFDATVNGSDLNLNWRTSSETNNAGFEVQLKGTGDYQAMGFVDGHGTTTLEQSYNYMISDLAPGTYTARLKQIDFDGAFEYSPQVEIAVGVPGTHVLTQAYPNPFNPQASFSLSVAAAQHVDVGLYNALGQRVASLFSGQMEAGQARAFTIDGTNLPSGSYYYRAIGQTFAESGRVTLLK